MSQYIAIAAIRIEHNYYNPPENSLMHRDLQIRMYWNYL